MLEMLMLAPLVLAAEISAANASLSGAPIEEAATERGFGCSLSGCGTFNQYTGQWSGTNWKGEHAAGNTYTGQWHANGWEGSATGNTHTGSATLPTLPLACACGPIHSLPRAGNYAATGWQGSIAGNGYSGGYVAQDNWGRTHYGNSHYGPYYLVKAAPRARLHRPHHAERLVITLERGPE